MSHVKMLLPLALTLLAVPALGQTDAAAKYQDAVDRLRSMAKGEYAGECTQAILIAALDPRVERIFIANLTNEHYVYRGTKCFPGLHGRHYVFIDFDCKPNVICLVDPNVLVVVDVPKGKVVRIENPYPAEGSDVTGSANRADAPEVRCDFSGNGNASLSFHDGVVSISLELSGKVKCQGVTVASYSEKTRIEKDLSDLQPCADIKKTVGHLKVEGRLCYEGEKVCFRDVGVFVDFRGHWHKVASISEVCLDL